MTRRAMDVIMTVTTARHRSASDASRGVMGLVFSYLYAFLLYFSFSADTAQCTPFDCTSTSKYLALNNRAMLSRKASPCLSRSFETAGNLRVAATPCGFRELRPTQQAHLTPTVLLYAILCS